MTTIANIRNMISHLNTITGNPESYRAEDGTIAIGHYTLGSAYGGHQLQQTVNNGGGVRVISECGYGTKKELGAFLNAYISGIEYKGAK